MADNLTLDIKKLQARITDMKHASLSLLPDTDTLQGIAEGLNSLSPLKWIKDIGGDLTKTLAMFCCFTIIFFSPQMHVKTLQELMKKEVARSIYFLLQKQKVGYAGFNSQHPVALAKP